MTFEGKIDVITLLTVFYSRQVHIEKHGGPFFDITAEKIELCKPGEGKAKG